MSTFCVWECARSRARNVGANSLNVVSRTFPHFSQPMLTPMLNKSKYNISHVPDKDIQYIALKIEPRAHTEEPRDQLRAAKPTRRPAKPTGRRAKPTARLTKPTGRAMKPTGRPAKLARRPAKPTGRATGVSGGIQFENLGQLPNGWTDRDQILHTCADSSWNGHRLKATPSRPQGAFWGNRR